ncbi:PUA domain containing protein [Histomonas meleagridis]|uniref:PUA domain containing protein n=1 Tax=Histomonas meleagridis TaxID=135588 RepID=UPI003559A95F|nr:PUA domain containing protein [Histomonas meleagridis]KAH0805171.1 PUA domain containing protein [Histomonas meleagridis]
MFAKLDENKLKKKATLKNNLLQKLKTEAKKYMKGFEEIEDKLFPKKTVVVVYHLENHLELYAVQDKPVLFRLGSGQVFPHLFIAMSYPGMLPAVYVDDGAVRALLRGADLMAPGIKQLPEPFEAGQVIEIRLLEQTVPFALGLAKVDSTEINANTKGVAIEIVHILKDDLWNKRNGL